MVRCKVNTEKVKLYDAHGNVIAAPKLWRGWRVSAQIQVKGRWETRQGTGITLELKDLMFVEEPQTTCPFMQSQ